MHKAELAVVDQQIVEAVRRGARQFYAIRSVCQNLEFRLIDRRLQSLRKHGILKYSRANHWELA
jgi:DNA-binding HxlR family transcriptional regulator